VYQKRYYKDFDGFIRCRENGVLFVKKGKKASADVYEPMKDWVTRLLK